MPDVRKQQGSQTRNHSPPLYSAFHPAPIVYVFYVKDYGMTTSKMRFPEEMTDTINGKTIHYNIKAIVHHEGPNRHSGHFKAYIKSENKMWYCADDDTVKIVTWETVMKSQPYILFYQKVGDKEAAEQHNEDMRNRHDKEKRIESYVKNADEDKKKEKEKKENPMIDLFNEEEEEKKKRAEKEKESNLKKRRPFYPIRDPLSHLRKMKVMSQLRPNAIQEEPQTEKFKVHEINQRESKNIGWNIESSREIALLEHSNKYMLGQVDRMRDQYDVEYDMGKVKKVKNKKNVQKINFDKLAKRMKKKKELDSS